MNKPLPKQEEGEIIKMDRKMSLALNSNTSFNIKDYIKEIIKRNNLLKLIAYFEAFRDEALLQCKRP